MMLHSNTVRSPMADPGRVRHSKRKAAADTPEGNERLSKRLSLLNLDNTGAKVYVAVPGSQDHAPPSTNYALAAAPSPPPTTTAALPVVLEEPQHQAFAITPITPGNPIATDVLGAPDIHAQPPSLRRSHRNGTAAAPAPAGDDDDMSLDDTKYKVYIHNIDDELADDEADDADHETTYEPVARDGSGKLVFLPVVDKHLRAAARDAVWSASLSPHAQPSSTAARPKLAVPRPIVPNRDGAIAGMQVVLYRDPTSLTVPPEQDRVRQAILDTRARYRQRLRSKDDEFEVVDVTDGDVDVDADADALDDTSMTSTPVPGTPTAAADDAGLEPDGMDLD